jgi:hypothetical protein
LTTLALLCAAPAAACAAAPHDTTGGAAYRAPRAVRAHRADLEHRIVPGTHAKRLRSGYAAAPADAPVAVQRAVWAANRIVGRPYVYGGGHGAFKSAGYDCSGTVSYALHGAGLLASPLDSGSFESWGRPHRGRWITVWTNAGHAFVMIAGLRLDTSSYGEPVSSGSGPRWRTVKRSGRGFIPRHPAGY